MYKHNKQSKRMELSLLLRRCLMAFLFLFLTSAMFAQDRLVSGKITDAQDGQPLPGVNVLIKGTNEGTVTDFDGNYKINVQDGAVLVFSFVGFTTQEVIVGAQSVIDISLSTDIKSLQEVVVVGYGTQDEKEITSAVTQIDSEDFNQGNITDPAQLLQGKVAGLTITSPGSNPNGTSTIRLRGLSTLGSESSPLVVIDGVIGADLNNVDPNDIESISVLKDGSAAAIYGVRGSSGVILVTTKSGAGREDATRLTLNSFVSFETIARSFETLNADEFRSLSQQLGTGVDLGGDTDFLDEITRSPAVSQVHNISLSGSAGNTNYRVSFNLRDRNGIQIGSGFTQYNARLNLTHNVFDDRLKLSTNISTTTRNSNFGFDEAFRYAITYNPTAPVTSTDPAFEQFGGFVEIGGFERFNPVAIIQQNQNLGRSTNLLANIRADLDLGFVVPGLRGSSSYSQQRINELNGEFYSTESQFRGNPGSAREGRARRFAEEDFNQLIEATVGYDRDFGRLNMQLLAGYSFQEFILQNLFTEVQDFLFDDISFNNLALGEDIANGLATINSFQDQRTIVAAFFRSNFTFDNKYFFSGTYRREGASVLGENNKFANFYAVSGGANIDQIVDIPVVSALKVRASFGVTGGLPGGNNITQLIFTGQGFFPNNGSFGQAFGPDQNANPDLAFERKEEFDVGLDFELLDGKISGTFDYYNRSTEDLIFPVDVPVPPNLATTTIANAAAFDNRGFEFLINYNVINTSDLNFTTSFNFGSFRTELTDFPLDLQDGGSVGAPGFNNFNTSRVEIGQELGQLIAPRFLGFENGIVILEDFDNDGDINADPDDFQVVGNGLPDFNIGLNFSLSYKRWDFNTFFRGTFGHDLLNNNRVFFEAPGNIGQFNVLSSSLDLVEQGFTGGNVFSDFFVESASFFRFDNFTVGYSIPVNSNNTINKLRLYVSGQNLFTITGYSGVDPEVRFLDTGAVDNGGFEPAEPDPLNIGIDRRNNFITTTQILFGVNLTIQ